VNVTFFCTFLFLFFSFSLISPLFSRPSENFLSLSFSLPLPGVPQEERSHDSSCYTNTTKYGNTHESFPSNLVVNECTQVRGLQVGGLLIEQEVVIAASFAVVAKLVVAECEIVEAFSAALRRDTEDIRE
jgi:hypothetical protein